MKYFLITFVAILHLGEPTFDSVRNQGKFNNGINSKVVLNDGDVDMQRLKNVKSYDFEKDYKKNTTLKSLKTPEEQRDFIFNIKKSGKSKEYIFVKTWPGYVSIVDSETHEVVTSYYAYDAMAYTSTIVVNDTVYNIDVPKGEIQTTSVENLMINNFTEWKNVGFFPEDSCVSICSPVVNDSIIFFLTCDSILYGYDMIHNSVIHIADVYIAGSYASMVLVNNILFASSYTRLYSFDGKIVREIPLPDERFTAGLFKLDNSVCIVGGNNTDVFPSPVQCYDTVGKNWTIHSYINDARSEPGVTTSQSGVHIFGGYCWKNDGLCKTAELLNTKYQKWGYIRDPFEGLENNYEPYYTQAFTFTF